ncbi:hypothetical protein BDN70DRAFT_827870 [Pholiota conissans]|uniref:Heterokaryon incompatibility domain-containing protein n=1 Tax=Pholiota conissans TaxID=109636 RepID=A0A9P6D4B2_9AGAR|nr:hypothetical protein BDN70DRAFT_827870 [Pholiota conissans]
MTRKSKETSSLSKEHSSKNANANADAVSEIASMLTGTVDFTADRGRVLVKSLENFVTPIIQTQTSSSGTSHSLSTEARCFLDALEKFIVSLTVPPKEKSRGADPKNVAKEALAKDDIAEINNSDSDIQKVVLVHPESLLKSTLQQAHQHVFNKMPLRLLSFRSDGSGMQLIERSAVWERISAAMRSDITHLQLSMDRVPGNAKDERRAAQNFISKHTKYAILSHTWIQGAPGEVTYTDWKTGHFNKASPGYEKLANFCRVAATSHGITLGWMDTICINKESSSELDESIRSMFRWYSNASICVTYLAQTATIEEMHSDPWFTRGWTLQELLAPRHTEFYGSTWMKITSGSDNDLENHSIQQAIEATTTITREELSLFLESRNHLPISRRMQWAARRQVTREEDTAYSLMGIFDVSISIAYGEGSERAFSRLLREILTSAKGDVLDVVNWCNGSGSGLEPHIQQVHSSSLLPTNPAQYLWRANKKIHWFPLLTPVSLTHIGLRIQVLLIQGKAADPDNPNRKFFPMGSYSAIVDIDAEDPTDPPNRLPRTYNLMDSKLHIIEHHHERPSSSRMLFGVLNFGETDDTITLPSSSCLAICLYSQSKSPVASIETSNIRKIETRNIITFDLIRYSEYTDWEVRKDRLSSQGMMLYTLHL